MDKATLAQMIASAQSKVPVAKDKPKPVKKGSVIISFHNYEMAELFLDDDRFMSLMPEYVFESAAGYAYVGAIYDTEEDARPLATMISQVKDLFDEELLAGEFQPNWLDDYLRYADMGIDYVALNERPVRDMKDVEALLKDKCQSVEGRKELEARERVALERSANYTLEQAASDLANFVIYNCDPMSWPSQSFVEKAMLKMVSQVSKLGEGHLFLDHYHAQDVRHAIDNKEQVLSLNAFSAVDKDSQEAAGQLAQLKRSTMASAALSDLLSGINRAQGKLYEQASAYCEEFLSKHLPDLTMEGIGPDETPCKYPDSPFKGIDFGHCLRGGGSFEERMSPLRVKDSREDQGYSFAHQLAGAITAYVFNVMEHKHNHSYEQALRDLSKRMDTERYWDHAVALVKDTRPSFKPAKGNGLDMTF